MIVLAIVAAGVEVPYAPGTATARWPYAQVVDDDVLVIETSWPATTIDGDPGIVSGMLSVSR
ncbi:MAG: hypothetical protein ACRDTJ_28850, partial [Pseudonocardiaceae bacterium]